MHKVGHIMAASGIMLVFYCSILPSRLPLDRIDGNTNPQLTLPLEGVKPLAIKEILTVSQYFNSINATLHNIMEF